MLNRAFLALVIIGSSSTAFAHPTTRDHRVDSRSEYYADRANSIRDDGEVYRQGFDLEPYRSQWYRPRPSWHALSVPARVSDDREGRVFINIDQRAPLMSMVRLDQLQGATYVFQVAVELANSGGTVKVRPQVILDPGRPTLTINLGGPRKIDRVIVYGSNQTDQSSFALMGL